MAQKYYNAAEAAKILGVSPADINEMVLRRELYGYRDGADWKFKTEDIERVAAERAPAARTKPATTCWPARSSWANPTPACPAR